jgi:DNA replication protein DnaC
VGEVVRIAEAIGNSNPSPLSRRLADILALPKEKREAIHAELDHWREQNTSQAVSNYRQAEAIRLSLMTGSMLERTFETAPVNTDSQRGAKSELEMFCENVERGIVDERGVCLFGDPGGLKSGLLLAMTNRILGMANPPGIVFVDCSDLQGYHDRGFDVKYAVFLAKIVVLDDFEKGLDDPDLFNESDDSQWIKSVFRRAERERCYTVFASTNSSIEEHKARFGTALASRLGGLMHWIQVLGKDARPDAYEVPYWAR